MDGKELLVTLRQWLLSGFVLSDLCLVRNVYPEQIEDVIMYLGLWPASLWSAGWTTAFLCILQGPSSGTPFIFQRCLYLGPLPFVSQQVPDEAGSAFTLLLLLGFLLRTAVKFMQRESPAFTSGPVLDLRDFGGGTKCRSRVSCSIAAVAPADCRDPESWGI